MPPQAISLTLDELDHIRIEYVTIVSAGRKYDDTFNKLQRLIEADGGAGPTGPWCVLNCLDRLEKDPSTGGIGSGEDGAFTHTQKAVMCQDGFVWCVTYCMDKILHHACRKVEAYCNKGMHRIDQYNCLAS